MAFFMAGTLYVLVADHRPLLTIFSSKRVYIPIVSAKFHQRFSISSWLNMGIHILMRVPTYCTSEDQQLEQEINHIATFTQVKTSLLNSLRKTVITELYEAHTAGIVSV